MILSQLKKCLDSEKKDNTLFDIVVYGSTVKGVTQARDLDIIVIFYSGTLPNFKYSKRKLRNLPAILT